MIAHFLPSACYCIPYVCKQSSVASFLFTKELHAMPKSNFGTDSPSQFIIYLKLAAEHHNDSYLCLIYKVLLQISQIHSNLFQAIKKSISKFNLICTSFDLDDLKNGSDKQFDNSFKLTPDQLVCMPASTNQDNRAMGHSTKYHARDVNRCPGHKSSFDTKIDPNLFA